MLRVLVVLPMYGGSLPVGRYAANGLREAGCLVEEFESPDFHGAFNGLKNLRVGPERLDALQNSFLQVVSQAVLAKAEAFAPDLVLCLAQAPLSRVALRKLRKDNIPTAMWFVEDCRLFTYWRAFAPYYDIFAVIQKDSLLSELADIGVEHALYLPLAADPAFHKPLDLTPAEKREFGSRLSFMGAGYPNRKKAFLRLLGQDMKIWGTEWEDAPALSHMVQRKGARISPEDTVRIYNAAEINLNLHSGLHGLVTGGDFVNPRTFELAACGAFQLVDERTLMPELFAEDELARFTDLEDMLEKIAWYGERPDERAAMAGRARARVLAEHTYARRMGQLLDFARERFPGMGSRKQQAWPENMPEDTRRDLSALLRDLALPGNAGFDDVIAALREKSGTLSDVEAALLFLDEWKKLYSR